MRYNIAFLATRWHHYEAAQTDILMMFSLALLGILRFVRARSRSGFTMIRNCGRVARR